MFYKEIYTHTIGNGIEILSISEASFGSEGTALARTMEVREKKEKKKKMNNCRVDDSVECDTSWVQKPRDIKPIDSSLSS